MLVIVFGLLLISSGCSAPLGTAPGTTSSAPAKALLDEAAAAMGGWAALDAVKSQEVFTSGNDQEPMQAVEPLGDARLINKFAQTVIADFEKNRVRLIFDAIRSYPNRQHLTFYEVIDGDAGMLETVQENGTTQRERLHPSRLVTRLHDVLRIAVRVLHCA